MLRTALSMSDSVSFVRMIPSASVKFAYRELTLVKASDYCTGLRSLLSTLPFLQIHVRLFGS